jgi:hypothetical protein
MKRTSVALTALLAATLWVNIGSAQQPPLPTGAPPLPPMRAPVPRPAANAYGPGFAAQREYSRRGTIKAFNSGPNGETNGLILSDGTAVFFPPETGEPLRASIKEGSRVTFTGVSRPGAFNRLIVDAQTITANGQTFTAAVVPPPPPGGPGALGTAGPPPLPDGPPPEDRDPQLQAALRRLLQGVLLHLRVQDLSDSGEHRKLRGKPPG